MPLHRGHQLLIDTALSQVDDLTILVYDSDPPGNYPPMPLPKRLAWLRALYPDIEAVLAVNDPHKHDPDRDDPKYAREYANELAFLGQFDVVFTSETGYEDFARSLGARHELVDTARELIPISGTQIRENVYEHRGWMDPLVYSSLIQKVVFVGTESTGKSTLARRMAEEYGTLWTHEFGRELWVKQDGGSFVDHVMMAERQYRREQAALRHSRDFLFCDTNPWTTLQWSLWAYGTADARLHELVDRTIGEYVWVLLRNDFPWADDGIREMRDGKAADFQARLRADMVRRQIGFYEIGGSLDRRVDAVARLLGSRWNARV